MNSSHQSGSGATKPLRPLTGTRILTIEHFIAGPLSTMILGDLGADVIKVELPEGDAYRNNPPVYENEYGKTSYSFSRANRNKRSISLDFRTDRGKEILRQLIAKSDVLLENFRPGVLKKMGFGWEEMHALNPRLIYATISGFGHTDVMPSPMAKEPAFDIIAQALSGIMWRPTKAGQPPTFLGIPLSDEIAGIMAATGVLSALNMRHLTGEGTRVDISMYDSTVLLMESAITYWGHFKEEGGRGASSTAAPYDVFKAKDGYFVLGVAGEPIWRRFCDAIGRMDLTERTDLASGRQRAAVLETVIRPLIEEWAADKTTLDACGIFKAAGVPCAPVQNVQDLFTCPHVKARNMIVELEDPVMGPIHTAGSPLKFSSVPEIDRRPPPQLGGHTSDLLSELLGLDEKAIADLEANGVVAMAKGKKVAV